MDSSILNSIKQLLGIEPTETHFDEDIKIHINSAFSNLNQMGVGPAKSFAIQSQEQTWDDFIDDDTDFNNVKTYIYLKVKLIFDPPLNSNVQQAMEREKNELEWRLTVCASNKAMEENDDDE